MESIELRREMGGFLLQRVKSFNIESIANFCNVFDFNGLQEKYNLLENLKFELFQLRKTKDLKIFK